MDQSLTVFAFPTITADWRKRFFDAYRTLAEQALAEPGCLIFQLHAHPLDEGRFVIHAEFVNQAAFGVHMMASHTHAFRDFIQITGSTLTYQTWHRLDDVPHG